MAYETPDHNMENDARPTPPSFDELVELIKKLFTDYLEDYLKTKPTEIAKSWERYKVLNHLWQDEEILTVADYEEVLADHRRLVQRLDELINGPWPASAKQPSLCDIVKQVESEGLMVRKAGGAAWLKGEYSRLYDQLKADPKQRIVGFVDYNRFGNNEVFRDICTIRGETMEFVSRGHGYGSSRFMSGNEKELFISLCESINVEWLDERGK